MSSPTVRCLGFDCLAVSARVERDAVLCYRRQNAGHERAKEDGGCEVTVRAAFCGGKKTRCELRQLKSILWNLAILSGFLGAAGRGRFRPGTSE